MFWQRRTTLERPGRIARRQGPRARTSRDVPVRGRGPALLLFLVRRRSGWTVLECFRSQADMGKSSRERELQGLMGSFRKSRVNQQQELSPGRFTAGQDFGSAHGGDLGPFSLPLRGECAQATHSGRNARRTGRVRVTYLFRRREKLRFVPLLSFLPERPPGAQ